MNTKYGSQVSLGAALSLIACSLTLFTSTAQAEHQHSIAVKTTRSYPGKNFKHRSIRKEIRAIANQSAYLSKSIYHKNYRHNSTHKIKRAIDRFAYYSADFARDLHHNHAKSSNLTQRIYQLKNLAYRVGQTIDHSRRLSPDLRNSWERIERRVQRLSYSKNSWNPYSYQQQYSQHGHYSSSPKHPRPHGYSYSPYSHSNYPTYQAGPFRR